MRNRPDSFKEGTFTPGTLDSDTEFRGGSGVCCACGEVGVLLGSMVEGVGGRCRFTATVRDRRRKGADSGLARGLARGLERVRAGCAGCVAVGNSDKAEEGDEGQNKGDGGLKGG